jgi:hypothetical protein
MFETTDGVGAEKKAEEAIFWQACGRAGRRSVLITISPASTEMRALNKWEALTMRYA